jgi:hypothetical protein
MPLNSGSSKATVSHNISEMVSSGHPQKQAVAAALRTARATGGSVKVHSGPIHSAVAGRTDHLPMNVASGSYVIPADIISAMGEGNSMAGFKVAKDIFSARDITSGTPYGEEGLPYGGTSPRKAGGGAADSGMAAARTSAPAPVSRASQPAPAAPQAAPATRYTGFRDMIDGGGKGASGSTFQGGAFSNTLNNLGVTPSGSEGGKGKFLPVMGGLIAGPIGAMAGMAVNRGYKGLGDMFNGGGPNAAGGEFSGGPMSNISNTAGVLPYSRAAGGKTDGVPIVAAGGEYVIPPEDVVHIGGGDLDHGHKVLDAFVKKMRQKTIKTLQGLPGPKKD